MLPFCAYLMPSFKEHKRSCVEYGIDEEVCEIVNRWMDKPSRYIPGCRHRELRHRIENCLTMALKLARGGAFTVALDIDPRAACCAKLNARRNRLSGLVDIVVGDLTSPFRKRCFDLIAFNPPYLPVEDQDPRWSGGPSGRAVSDRFIEEAALKLRGGGSILLVQSTTSGIEEALSKLKAKELRVRVVRVLKVGLFEELALIEALKLNLK